MGRETERKATRPVLRKFYQFARQHLELVEPGFWKKFDILSLDRYVRITLLDKDGSSADKFLFCDLPGEQTLTIDGDRTLEMFEFTREIMLAAQLRLPTRFYKP